MGERVNGLAVVSVVTLLLLGGWAIAPAGGSESTMCPPVTIDDLFADTTTSSTSTTTSTTTSSTTSTTTPTTSSSSTTVASDPPSTTTPAPTSTTTAPTESTEPQTTPDSTGTTSTTEAATPSTSVPTTTAPPTTEEATTTTTAPAEPPCDTPFVYPLVFPLAGQGYIGSPFGAARDGGRRLHLGNDIAAPHLQPVVAAADGTVTRIAGDTGISGYRVHIGHDDGWSTLYIHLNNDTAGTDDGSGIGIRPDLREGDRVKAGEVIGWNGDSGNAETTEHHLHFELRDPSGTSVDPRASLEAAEQVHPTFEGAFIDVETSDAVRPLDLLLTRGAPVWCGEGIGACPDDPATGQVVATWLQAVVGGDPNCEPACDELTELDLVRMLASLRSGDDASAESAVEVFSRLDGAALCLDLPNDSAQLTRAEAAETLVAWLGWIPRPHCPTSALNR